MADPASSDLRSLPLVRRLEPPYESLQPVRDPAVLDPRRLRRGTILVLGVERSPPEASLDGVAQRRSLLALAPASKKRRWPAAALAERVGVLRRRFPAYPIVLLLDGVSQRVLVDAARHAAELHVRGVLLEDDAVAATLRLQLTDPEHLAPDFLRWLPCCDVALPEATRFVVEQIFLAGRRHRRLRDVLPRLGMGSASTIRDRFRREGLPSPRQWRRLAEALYAVLRIQREAGSLITHAVELGYSEGSSLSHQMAGVFGATPGVIRQTIGWQWWADVWVQARRARGEFAVDSTSNQHTSAVGDRC